MAWRRKAVRLRVDRELAEKTAEAFQTSADPQALSNAFRAHLDCERERRRLLGAVEKAAREVLDWEKRFRSLEARHESLLQDNAALIVERRRLEESSRALRKQLGRERDRSGAVRAGASNRKETA